MSQSSLSYTNEVFLFSSNAYTSLNGEDWRNWVCLKNNSKMVVENIEEVGDIIRLYFKGVNTNVVNVR